MLNSEIQEILQREFPEFQWKVMADLEWVDDPSPCRIRILSLFTVNPGQIVYSFQRFDYPDFLTDEALRKVIGPEMVQTIKDML